MGRPVAEKRKLKRQQEDPQPQEEQQQQQPAFKRPRLVSDLRRNARGVIVTAATPNHAKDAVREAIFLLKRYVSPDSAKAEKTEAEVAATVSDADDDDNVVDVEAQIAKKRQQEGPLPLSPMSNFLKGIGYIQFAKEITIAPNSAVLAAFEELVPSPPDDAPKRKFHSKFLQRVIPVEISCSPHPAQFKRLARAVVEAYFPKSAVVSRPEDFADFEKVDDDNNCADRKKSEDIAGEPVEGTPASENARRETAADPVAVTPDAHTKEDSKIENDDTGVAPVVEVGEGDFEMQLPVRPTVVPAFTVPAGATWCCAIETRAGMKTLPRSLITDSIGSLVGGENYKVDLKAAQYVVTVEVNNKFCGIAVMPKYFEYRKLNVRSFTAINNTADKENKTAAPVVSA